MRKEETEAETEKFDAKKGNMSLISVVTGTRFQYKYGIFVHRNELFGVWSVRFIISETNYSRIRFIISHEKVFDEL